MPLIDSATYRSGIRIGEAHPSVEAHPRATEHTGENISLPDLAWIGLYRPTELELSTVAARFGLHRLAVEDASSGHQRSKLERYGNTLFVVIRTARWVENTKRVEFGELDIFVGPGFLVTVRHAEAPDLAAVRRRLESNHELLALGAEAVLYAVLDQVVDEYAPIVVRLENAVDALEDQIFQGAPEVSRKIYDLLGQVVEFQRAVHPLKDMLERLRRGSEKYGVDAELRSDLRDVLDHVIRVNERADSFRVLLQNALTLHSTIVSRQQNDEMRALSEASLAQNEETRRLTETSLAQSEGVKKVSALAAIFFGPTLIASVYGMNFQFMPELHWKYGYPLALALMVASGAVLYGVFRRKKWL